MGTGFISLHIFGSGVTRLHRIETDNWTQLFQMASRHPPEPCWVHSPQACERGGKDTLPMGRQKRKAVPVVPIIKSK